MQDKMIHKLLDYVVKFCEMQEPRLERKNKDIGIAGVHLITAGEGNLPYFYGQYGFKKEKIVILMGKELC